MSPHDLDEGPIIEQDVARVDHSMTAHDLVRIGSDIESLVLARAVSRHIEHRILLNGHLDSGVSLERLMHCEPAGLVDCRWAISHAKSSLRVTSSKHK